MFESQDFRQCLVSCALYDGTLVQFHEIEYENIDPLVCSGRLV